MEWLEVVREILQQSLQVLSSIERTCVQQDVPCSCRTSPDIGRLTSAEHLLDSPDLLKGRSWRSEHARLSTTYALQSAEHLFEDGQTRIPIICYCSTAFAHQ